MKKYLKMGILHTEKVLPCMTTIYLRKIDEFHLQPWYDYELDANGPKNLPKKGIFAQKPYQLAMNVGSKFDLYIESYETLQNVMDYYDLHEY